MIHPKPEDIGREVIYRPSHGYAPLARLVAFDKTHVVIEWPASCGMLNPDRKTTGPYRTKRGSVDWAGKP